MVVPATSVPVSLHAFEALEAGVTSTSGSVAVADGQRLQALPNLSSSAASKHENDRFGAYQALGDAYKRLTLQVREDRKPDKISQLQQWTDGVITAAKQVPSFQGYFQSLADANVGRLSSLSTEICQKVACAKFSINAKDQDLLDSQSSSPALGVLCAQGFCIARASRVSDNQAFTALHCLEGAGSTAVGEVQLGETVVALIGTSIFHATVVRKPKEYQDFNSS